MNEHLMYRREFYIDGEWTPPIGTDYLDVVSPSTEGVVGGVPLAGTEDIDRAVSAARRAFEGSWSKASNADRAALLAAVAEELRKRADDLVAVQVDETGITAASAAGQAAALPMVLDYYAELTSSYAFERKEDSGAARARVVREPVGVVGAITPWNGPNVLSVWKIGPALAAGCTVVLKPPPESPLSPLVLADAFDAAGTPAGVVNILPGDRTAGEHLVSHPGTDKIAFTGSTAAGKRIMSLCGEQVKRVSLELGGKSAAVMLPDVDLADVVPRFVRAELQQSGQRCVMHSRVLVHRDIYDEAVELAATTAASLKIGDPHEPDTLIGPLVAKRQQDRVFGYFQIALDEGARVVTGGGRPAHMPKGWYVEPTVLADVKNTMRIAREEIFGPVFCFIPYRDDDEAVAIANDSDYGLGGGIWGADQKRALRVARRIRAGNVSINGAPAPQPLTPFGGFKQSGLGRELGPEGLESYLEPKTISYR